MKRDSEVAVVAAVARGLRGVLDLILPPRCLGCGAVIDAQGGLCAACWRGLTFLGPPCCRLCGYPLPHALPDAPLCGRCAVEAPAFDRARAALRTVSSSCSDEIRYCERKFVFI